MKKTMCRFRKAPLQSYENNVSTSRAKRALDDDNTDSFSMSGKKINQSRT